MIIAQTLSEYGFLTSVVAGVASARDRIELYIGSGNLKYVLLATLVICILTLAKLTRRT